MYDHLINQRYGRRADRTIKTVTAAPPVNPDAFRWKFLETVLGNGQCRCEFLKLPASKMCVFFYLFVFCYNYPATNWWTVKLRSWYDYLNTAGLYFFSERQAGNKLKSKASKKKKKKNVKFKLCEESVMCVKLLFRDFIWFLRSEHVFREMRILQLS